MHGLPKIVLERLKREGIGNQLDRQSAIDNRQSAMGDRQSAIEDGQFPHPDANLLAAFVERTLTERERTEVLNHLAKCAECRELAALILPAKVDVAQLKPLPARRAWWAWPMLRWGALAVAAGTVAIVVVLRMPWPRRQEAVSKQMASTLVASVSKTERQPPAELPAQPRPQGAVAKAGAKSRESPRPMAKIEKAPGPLGGLQVAAYHGGAEAKQSETLVAAAAPPAATEPAPSKAESGTIATELNARLAGGVSAPGRTLSGPVTAAPLRAKPYSVGAAGIAFRGSVANAVAQPAALWTISPGGKVQRSDDRGKTWGEVSVDDSVTFRVIQATGRDVWAGGSGGALFHSTDGGATWKRVNLSSDGRPTTETIVAIISSTRDLEHITVIAASGEQWTTEDGGQHWQRKPSSP
jgi:hypothetical protein